MTTSTLQRVYINLLMKMCDDYARENEFGHIEIEQDADLMDKIVSPVKMTLVAAQAATVVTLPMGATAVRFIALHLVSSASGINVHLGGAASTAILVKPPDGVDKEGFFFLTTNTASVWLSNPSATASVTCKIALGCT